MGDLPLERVIKRGRAFITTGVDYAGPFAVRESRHRGRAVISKGYVALFICFNTKVIHLEFVSELVTEVFLAALDRKERTVSKYSQTMAQILLVLVERWRSYISF